MDPLRKACFEGKTASAGGLNLAELRNKLVALYPDHETQICRGSRMDIEALGCQLIEGKTKTIPQPFTKQDQFHIQPDQKNCSLNRQLVTEKDISEWKAILSDPAKRIAVYKQINALVRFTRDSSGEICLDSIRHQLTFIKSRGEGKEGTICLVQLANFEFLLILKFAQLSKYPKLESELLVALFVTKLVLDNRIPN